MGVPHKEGLVCGVRNRIMHVGMILGGDAAGGGNCAHLNKVERLGALGQDEDALLGRSHEGHQAVHELPLGGHAHHLAVLLVLRPRVVQQVRVVAHLCSAGSSLTSLRRPHEVPKSGE